MANGTAGIGGLLLLMAVCSGASARAQVPSEAETAPPPEGPEETTADDAGTDEAAESVQCELGAHRLDGAEVEAADDASFKREWTTTLERIAQCMQTPAMAEACVTVQGRFDETPFDSSRAAVTALGSEKAAQNARARGRSARVVSHLFELGVAPDRIRELPPPAAPSYRGVEIRIEEQCVGRPRATRHRQKATTQAKPDRATGASTQGDGAAERESVEAPADTPAPPPTHRFWVDLELGGQGIFSGVGDVLSGLSRIGAGWRYDLFYARAAAGASIGNQPTHRVGFGFVVGAGLTPLEWLQAGAVVAYDSASHKAGSPWTDRHWSLGVEAIECVDLPTETAHLDVCVAERFGFLGRRSRRADSVGGQVVFVPEQSADLLSAELGVSLRLEL